MECGAMLVYRFGYSSCGFWSQLTETNQILVKEMDELIGTFSIVAMSRHLDLTFLPSLALFFLCYYHSL